MFKDFELMFKTYELMFKDFVFKFKAFEHRLSCVFALMKSLRTCRTIYVQKFCKFRMRLKRKPRAASSEVDVETHAEHVVVAGVVGGVGLGGSAYHLRGLLVLVEGVEIRHVEGDL